MKSVVARRLLASVVLLWVVVSASFFLLHLLPGDPAATYEDPRIPPQHRARLGAIYGLDKPLPEQYVRWLAAAARGEWGYSFTHQRPVAQVLGELLPRTLVLSTAALAIEFAVGVPLGLFAASRAGRFPDGAIRGIALALCALPTFWLGLVAALVFAVQWPLFPVAGYRSVGAEAWPFFERAGDLLRHLALPAATLGLPAAAAMARFARQAALEAIGSDFVRAAEARGVAPRRILFHHVLRSSAPSLAQLLGFSVSGLLSGAIAVEVVFGWPGVGRVSFEAVGTRDYPLLLAATTISAAMAIAGGLLADLLQAAFDPRLRETVT